MDRTLPPPPGLLLLLPVLLLRLSLVDLDAVRDGVFGGEPVAAVVAAGCCCCFSSFGLGACLQTADSCSPLPSTCTVYFGFGFMEM